MAGSRKKTVHRILMVTTEAIPFAKSGGLADAVSALAQELDRAGHDVRIIMPRYYGIRRERLHRYPSPFPVQVADTRYDCALFEGRLPGSDVVVYFLDYEELYGRDGIYGNSHGPFPDNLMRFTVLSHAASVLSERIGWEPEILHAHDWPTGLVPMLTKRSARRRQPPACVFTIHNLGYQGLFPVSELPGTGLEWSELNESGLLHYNELNLLRSGIVNSDMVTTVSPTYATEIRTPTCGFSLDPLLSERAKTLVGIRNGIDYALWNPEGDDHLEVNYTAETVALKERNKALLQEEVGLPVDDEVPLFGMISRLVSQKGFEELLAPGYGALPDILSRLPVQMLVLGTGESRYERELRQLARRFDNFQAVVGFDEPLAHRIEAGSDFFLMPSRYEPCGLNQLYSLRYGTIPVVTQTGGLADTVRDISEENGNGFVIDSACPAAIVRTVERVASLWTKNRNKITALRQSAMKERHTWEASARKYVKVYRDAIRRRSSA